MGESAQQSRSDVLRVSRWRCQKTPPAPHPWLWNLLYACTRIEQQEQESVAFMSANTRVTGWKHRFGWKVDGRRIRAGDGFLSAGIMAAGSQFSWWFADFYGAKKTTFQRFTAKRYPLLIMDVEQFFYIYTFKEGLMAKNDLMNFAQSFAIVMKNPIRSTVKRKRGEALHFWALN